MDGKDTKEKVTKAKVLKGTVVSDKMKDTVVVAVERFIKHPKYGKYYKVRKKYKVHDPDNSKKPGDKVNIQNCKPISKDKHFIVIQGTK